MRSLRYFLFLAIILVITPEAMSQQLVGSPKLENAPTPEEMIVVVYAIENIRKGRRVTDSMLQEVPLSSTKASALAIRCRKQAIGRKAKCDIAAGSVLMSSILNCETNPASSSHSDCSKATMVFATRDLAKGTVIRPSDVVMKSISPFDLPSRVPNRVDLVIGMETKQSVQSGAALVPGVLLRTTEFRKDKRNLILF